MFFVSFRDNFKNCWDSVYVGITFVKCLQLNNKRNVSILHFCQKFCHLHWYVFHLRRSSPTLKLSKNFHLTGVEDSGSTGCSATKFGLQTIFERCFENARKYFMENSAIKFLFSKLQSFKLKPLALSVLKVTKIPEMCLL